MKIKRPFHPKLSILALSVVLLSGCGALTRSEFQEPSVQVPASWQSEALSDAVSMDPWWRQFNDPELNTLVATALANNNDLALATLTLQRARLQAGISRQDLYPQLSSSISGSHSEDLDSGANSHSYSANLSVSYELDLWGRLSANLDAANWSTLASAEDREATAQSLVATTASLYWQIGYLEQRLALADASIDYAEQTLELTRTQYDAGAVSRLNVLQATRSLSSQRASRIELDRQLNEAQNALSILFNQPPGEIETSITQLPAAEVPEVRAGIPADLMVRRPDVKSALYSLQASLASRDATFADYLPTLTLTGQIGDSSSALKELLRDPVGSLGVGLVLPFLQWNEMQLNRDIAEIDYESAVITYRDTLYQAFEDVDNSLSAISHYRLQSEELKQQYEAAEEAERLYESQYRNGAAAIQDWLDAQDDRRSAEESLLENRYNRLTSVATLYQALGGSDTAPAMPEAEPEETE